MKNARTESCRIATIDWQTVPSLSQLHQSQVFLRSSRIWSSSWRISSFQANIRFLLSPFSAFLAITPKYAKWTRDNLWFVSHKCWPKLLLRIKIYIKWKSFRWFLIIALGNAIILTNLRNRIHNLQSNPYALIALKNSKRNAKCIYILYLKCSALRECAHRPLEYIDLRSWFITRRVANRCTLLTRTPALRNNTHSCCLTETLSRWLSWRIQK